MNHPPTYVRTFPLHKVRENCHFLDHPPTPMSLRNIKIAPSKLYSPATLNNYAGKVEPGGAGGVQQDFFRYKQKTNLLLQKIFYLHPQVFIPSASTAVQIVSGGGSCLLQVTWFQANFRSTHVLN